MQDKRAIQTYSLADALYAAQQGALEGYALDLETNEGYPQQFGSMIVFSMVKVNVAKEKTNVAQDATEATGVSSDITVESTPEKKTRAKAQK